MKFPAFLLVPRASCRVLEFREQYDTLLIIGIGAGNDRDAALIAAQIVRLMRHIGGDVEKVSGSCDGMLFEFLAAPHAGFTAEDLEGGLMTVVLMRFWLLHRVGS